MQYYSEREIFFFSLLLLLLSCCYSPFIIHNVYTNYYNMYTNVYVLIAIENLHQQKRAALHANIEYLFLFVFASSLWEKMNIYIFFFLYWCVILSDIKMRMCFCYRGHAPIYHTCRHFVAVNVQRRNLGRFGKKKKKKKMHEDEASTRHLNILIVFFFMTWVSIFCGSTWKAKPFEI